MKHQIRKSLLVVTSLAAMVGISGQVLANDDHRSLKRQYSEKRHYDRDHDRRHERERSHRRHDHYDRHDRYAKRYKKHHGHNRYHKHGKHHRHDRHRHGHGHRHGYYRDNVRYFSKHHMRGCRQRSHFRHGVHISHISGYFDITPHLGVRVHVH